MSDGKLKWHIIKVIKAFFPLQLLVSHLKHNLISLFFWLGLTLIINDQIGYAFGIPFLFLSPEYLGEVSLWSFLFLGFSIGGFTMGFNTYSYMRLGPRFPFLTTLNKPFLKFCINNSIIPLAFVILYIVRIIQFQHHQELQSYASISVFIFAFLLGIAVFLSISFFYFFRVGSSQNNEEQKSKPIFSFLYKRDGWYNDFKRQHEKASIYFGSWFQLKISRSSEHFDKELTQRVFAKNRINASIFEIATIGMFFLLGAFGNLEVFELPAAVSIVLLLTITHMLFSALQSWFKGWTYVLLIAALIGMDYISQNTNLFHYTSYAYGLNYDIENRDKYNIQRLNNITIPNKSSQQNKENYIETLKNWKARTNEEKPKLIIINTSGGGSRSAMWTMTVLQRADKILDGKLRNHTQLITGASGGMIGAAYFRELMLRESKGEIESIHKPKYRAEIGKDMLNRLSFSASTNDIFVRYQKTSYNNHSYTIDRGFAFEEQLHANTNHLMNHNLGYYKKYEQAGEIPTMIFNPTIINDGRRLIISSQQLDFLSTPPQDEFASSIENIDYHRLCAKQNTDELRFSSVLRANATFPFVMPMVTLPTNPEIQLMDAGIRDNYGTKTMIEYLNTLEEWISENTSGVIVIQIRDTKKILKNEKSEAVSFMDKLSLPFGNMYKNFPRVQDFNQDELINFSRETFEFPIDVLSFNLREDANDRISLSWHLTKQEKQKIEDAFERPSNKIALATLKKLL